MLGPIGDILVVDDTLEKVKDFHVGDRDHIAKPFQPEEVMMRVDYQIRLSRLQKKWEIQDANLEDANQKLKEINTLKAKSASEASWVLAPHSTSCCPVKPFVSFHRSKPAPIPGQPTAQTFQ